MKRLAIVLLALTVCAGVQARDLTPYKGDPTPPELKLEDLSGKVRDLKDFKGQVVLVNFWATWCPPCRAEMPSMWHLQDKFRNKPFRVIAVNMGETNKEVNTFLADKMKQDFVVLMDRNGDALKRWKVFAFPTSYLIDKEGKIRYGLYGATEWDGFDNVKFVEGLLK